MGLSLKRNAVWNAASVVSVRAIGLLFWVVVARLVSSEELGELLTIQATAFTAIRLVSTGFSSASISYIATAYGQGPKATKEAAKTALIVGTSASVVLASLLYFAADLLAVVFWHRPSMVHSLHLAALFALCTGFAASFAALMYGIHEFQRFGAVMILGNVTQLVLGPVLISYFGFLGAIHALSASQTVIALGGAFLAVTRIFSACDTVGTGISREGHRRDVFALGKRTFIAAVAHGVFEAAAWLSLGFLIRQPDGLTQSAVYGVASQWRQITLFVPTILMQVSLPAFATLTRDVNNPEITGDLGRFEKFMKLYLFATAILLSIGSPLLLSIYGANYAGGWDVFVVMQLAALFQGLQAYRVTEIQGKGRFDLLLAINIPAGITLVLVSWQLSRFGAIGLAVAFVCAFIITEIALNLIRNRTTVEYKAARRVNR